MVIIRHETARHMGSYVRRGLTFLKHSVRDRVWLNITPFIKLSQTQCARTRRRAPSCTSRKNVPALPEITFWPCASWGREALKFHKQWPYDMTIRDAQSIPRRLDVTGAGIVDTLIMFSNFYMSIYGCAFEINYRPTSATMNSGVWWLLVSFKIYIYLSFRRCVSAMVDVSL